MEIVIILLVFATFGSLALCIELELPVCAIVVPAICIIATGIVA